MSARPAPLALRRALFFPGLGRAIDPRDADVSISGAPGPVPTLGEKYGFVRKMDGSRGGDSDGRSGQGRKNE